MAAMFSACMSEEPIKVPTKPLGKSGLHVPVIALGCFAFGGDKKTGVHLSPEMAKLHEGVWGDQEDVDTYATVKAALDAGVNFFDNAEMCASLSPIESSVTSAALLQGSPCRH